MLPPTQLLSCALILALITLTFTSAQPPVSCGIGDLDFSAIWSGGHTYTDAPSDSYPIASIKLCGAVTDFDASEGCLKQIDTTCMICEYNSEVTQYDCPSYYSSEEFGGIVWAYVNGRDPTDGVTFTTKNGDDCADDDPGVVGTITCDENADPVEYLDYDNSDGVCNIRVTMSSKYACANTPPPSTVSSSASTADNNDKGGGGGGGLSGGSVFLIIFFVVLFVYCAGGAALNQWYFKVEPGLQTVPNVSFWKDLPFLIKDGMVFTFVQCRALCNRGGGGKGEFSSFD